MSNHGITRRQAVGAGIATAAGLVLAKPEAALAHCGGCGKGKKKECAMPKNEDFYKDGKFLEDKARQAYYDMFERFGYPNPKPQQELMWVLDFGMGDFVHAGMDGIFWHNSQDYGYFGHSIYLLPGQQIPEHKHLATDNGPAKMEAWHVNHGMIYTFGEGPETKPLPVKLPESQEQFRTVKNCAPLMPGEVRELNRLEAFHFMIAGPEGAVVTEYGTFHDMDGLRFANPNAKV